ncbi:MAG: HD-GYP domain-containing protein [Lachnospiraceae bacterium]|nr:HD-GYP domain-containing protein [Lachnospiraceae bacterium]
MNNVKKGSFRYGVAILILMLAVIIAGLAALLSKINRDLSTPFQYHFQINEDASEEVITSSDGSIISDDGYVYTVEISKHWLNDPGGPLENYGAQYDNTIVNGSSFDIVKWSAVIEVPEKNITIDSSWSGEWVYDKQSDTISFTPEANIATIKSGKSVTFGAVMISDELMNFTDMTFSGCRYKPITGYLAFWILMVMLIVWITSSFAYILYRIRERNYRKNSEKLNNVISQTMSTFANFIDTKDRYTKGHSARVSYYSQKIAEKLGFSDEQIRDIGYIGLMHDCGKLGIPGDILKKPGVLTKEEFDIMKTHTTNGGAILKDFTAIDGMKEGVVSHHERYDGTGYMEGLAGEDIPLVARIICVADALDAMNSDRCYRNHLNRETILSELENNKGTQFDPKIAQIMIDMIKSGEVFLGE